MHQAEFINLYEKANKKSYRELYSEGDPTKWGNVKYKGIITNQYAGQDLIHDFFVKPIMKRFAKKTDLVISDFGGGDGTLLFMLQNQISKNFNLYLESIDLNKKFVSPFGPTQELQGLIKFIYKDILWTHKPSYADVICNRYVLQYFNKENQKKVIDNIHHSLKEEGLALLVWPCSIKSPKIYNKIFAEIVSLIVEQDSNEVMQHKYFASLNEIKSYMNNTGFTKIKKIGNEAQALLSVKSWSDRFDFSTESYQGIEELYEIYSKKHPELFTELGGELCLKTDIVGLSGERK